MLIEGLVALLNATSAITDVVGDRIQPWPAPEDLSLYPLITYQMPSDVTGDANDGPDGMATVRVIFDCLSPRYLEARGLALALKTLLHGKSFTLSDGTQVDRATAANISDDFVVGNRIYGFKFHAMIQYRD